MASIEFTRLDQASSEVAASTTMDKVGATMDKVGATMDKLHDSLKEFKKIQDTNATKQDLVGKATKQDLVGKATKQDFAEFMTVLDEFEQLLWQMVEINAAKLNAAPANAPVSGGNNIPALPLNQPVRAR